MSRHSTLRKAGPLLGAFLLCLSGIGLVGPASQARADEAPQDQASPVGVDAQGNPLDIPQDLLEAANRESGAMEESTDGYSPDGGSDEKVIGEDGRRHITNTTDYPNSAIVYLHKHNGNQYCTGWLVSPDTLVTAGHCIYNNNGWNFDLEYSPGANGAERPYGTAKAARIWTDTSWISNRNNKQDWGIVKLDKSFPQVGYFGYRWQEASLNGTEVELRGYPGDKPAGQLWGMAGPITDSSSNNLSYQIDTVGGQSGSPVFLGDVHQSVAIHTTGANRSNSSTRITESLFNIISKLRS